MRFLLVILALCQLSGIAQDKYLVFFSDKDGVQPDYETYLDRKAIQRRLKSGFPLDHFTDLPVREDYCDRVAQNCDTLRYSFRWLNAVSCYATAEQISIIRSFPFVTEAKLISPNMPLASVSAVPVDELKNGKLLLAEAQIKRMKGEEFALNGLSGKGIRIAILDAGFPKVGILDAFAHIRKRNGIVDTYDFLKNKKFALTGNSHGTMVLSNIAGIVDGNALGMATGAEFLLARTESLWREGLSDEESWLAAIEWADKRGADIVNSSLGYTNRLYFRKDMDGITSLISRSASLAAAKGILVVNSAGNEGDNDNWIMIGAPADNDSVLAVGGINPWTNMHTSWSSYGPSADKRLKPNVCAYGHTIVANSGGVSEATGTSFASPLTAGFAACAWEADTSITNMELFRKIEESGDLYPYFDYAHGYGVPQADYFITTADSTPPTFEVIRTDTSIRIEILEDRLTYASLPVSYYYGTLNSDPERANNRLNGYFFNMLRKAIVHYPDTEFNNQTTGIRSGKSDYFFFHIENKEGYLDVYYVLGVEQRNVLNYTIGEDDAGKIMRFHYKGYTTSIVI